MRDTAGKLDDLESTLYRTSGVVQYLAVLLRYQRRDLRAVAFDQLFELEHDLRTPQNRRLGPASERGMRCSYRRICIGLVRHDDFRTAFSGRRIEYIAVSIGTGFLYLTIDPVRDLSDCFYCRRFLRHVCLPAFPDFIAVV